MTVNGSLRFSRYVLRPKSQKDRERLWSAEGLTAVVPMDCYLGIASLPFKLTPAAMLEVAYWAQNQPSYQAAEDAILKTMGIKINDDTVRLASNAVGGMVFERDCEIAQEAYERLCSGKLSFPSRRKEGILYIETDGAALNTRQKNKGGSTWLENKLGVVFSSDNMRFLTDKHGRRQGQITKREYVSFVGGVDEFKKHLFACAVRNGYGKYKKTIILSDGAAWIRNMKEEMFPDAQQILDYYRLCENVDVFAKHVYGMDESKYKPWSERICAELKAGRFEGVLAELEKTDQRAATSSPVNLHRYISNNKNAIDYAEYTKNGYLIGNGAVEGANKTILQQRLKQAGMRWNPETAQCLLTLKAKHESGLWLRDVASLVASRFAPSV